nr:LexA family transcriptional regulator [Hymenobacter properus]
MTQLQLAEQLGLSISAISKFETGNSSLSFDTLKKVAALYNVSTDYLLIGSITDSEAPSQNNFPYNAAEVAPSTATDVEAPYTNASRIHVDKLNLTVLPYIPLEARAGLAEFYADDVTKYPWENAETLAVIDVPNTSEYKEAIVVAINGDSMDPTIKNGSKVVVTPVQRGNWQYLNPGVYCIIFLNNFVVKRVKDNTLLENGLLRLHSDNPAGGTFQIKGEDIRAVWRVRWAAYTPIE